VIVLRTSWTWLKWTKHRVVPSASEWIKIAGAAWLSCDWHSSYSCWWIEWWCECIDGCVYVTSLNWSEKATRYSLEQCRQGRDVHKSFGYSLNKWIGEKNKEEKKRGKNCRKWTCFISLMAILCPSRILILTKKISFLWQWSNKRKKKSQNERERESEWLHWQPKCIKLERENCSKKIVCSILVSEYPTFLEIQVHLPFVFVNTAYNTVMHKDHHSKNPWKNENEKEN